VRVPAPAIVLCGYVALTLVACTAPARDPSRTTKGTYDKTTGKLTELASDRNRNGTTDTWTEMDGTRPLRSRIDLDEDGRIDRWEYYDAAGALTKVGFSRKSGNTPDAWAYSRPDGSLERVELSSTADEHKIDRRQNYEAGVMVRVEEDTEGNGHPDTWEFYDGGVLKAAEFDENQDGKPDRRLTYAGGNLATIESEPDGSGRYMKKEVVQK
jgi:hypothetical protein